MASLGHNSSIGFIFPQKNPATLVKPTWKSELDRNFFSIIVEALIHYCFLFLYLATRGGDVMGQVAGSRQPTQTNVLPTDCGGTLTDTQTSTAINGKRTFNKGLFLYQDGLSKYRDSHSKDKLIMRLIYLCDENSVTSLWKQPFHFQNKTQYMFHDFVNLFPCQNFLLLTL